VNHALHGSQTPATQFVPPVMGLNPQSPFKDGNIIEAKLLLEKACEEAGISLQTLNQLRLSYPSSDRAHRIAQVLQQQWLENLGLRITLEPLEPKVYFSQVAHKNFDLAIASWFADFNDPINFLEVYRTSSHLSNRTAYEDPEMEQLINLSYREKDPAARLQILSLAEKKLLDGMPIIPLSHASLIYVKNEMVHDVVLSGTGEIDFKWAYIDD
jgi:oligopeptide transport system substrate-binding protein